MLLKVRKFGTRGITAGKKHKEEVMKEKLPQDPQIQ